MMIPMPFHVFLCELRVSMLETVKKIEGQSIGHDPNRETDTDKQQRKVNGYKDQESISFDFAFGLIKKFIFFGKSMMASQMVRPNRSLFLTHSVKH